MINWALDNDPLGPWCYTTDKRKRFDYCDITPCSGSDDSDGSESGFNAGSDDSDDSGTNETDGSKKCGNTRKSLLRLGTALYSNGKHNIDVDGGRIIGGKTIASGMLPWQVKLHGPAGCGGTLVSMTVSTQS